MIGNLSSEEVEDLIRKQFVGRIGCYDKGLVYVVPTSYAYDDNCIYCHSYEGKKIEMMRKNPQICFQVDEMKDMANWKSVIAWGDFEEITNEEEKIQALKILLKRRLPIPSSITTHLGKTWPFTANGPAVLKEIPGIVFKITLTEKTGKFESSPFSPMIMFN
jgi:nitroimidazol reductase NimA-like FMN-containing flavoprotein (pyridoxamine 5'-phosphate oxidase superfamily)